MLAVRDVRAGSADGCPQDCGRVPVSRLFSTDSVCSDVRPKLQEPGSGPAAQQYETWKTLDTQEDMLVNVTNSNNEERTSRQLNVETASAAFKSL